MQKIIPHFWFDKEAVEAVNYYTSIFPNSKINSIVTLRDTPSGDSELVTFEVLGYKMMAINGGPYFKMNSSFSLNVVFNLGKDSDAKEKLEETYNKLVSEGKALYPLGKYPYAELYAWVVDKYGLSWQLLLLPPAESQDINLYMTFAGSAYGRAEEAIDFYTSVFKNSKKGEVYYRPNEDDKAPKTIMFSDFVIENHYIMASDENHDDNFSEAISLLVLCEDQEEIDYYWDKLSHDKEAEQCGWLKDKFGVSWQINPKIINEMLENGTDEQIARVMAKLMPMKKIILQELIEAYNGK